MMQPVVKSERIDLPNYHLQQQQIQLQQQQQSQQQGHQQQMAPQMNSASARTPSVQQTVNRSNIVDNIEAQPDFQSIKGVFGWTSIDNVNVPYILRGEKQFVSVRIVEMKLLNRYPNSYPDDLGKHAPLTSFFITQNEAKLLNEINLQHCGGEYGKKDFSCKELIVLLSDFKRFYDLVKKTFPDAASAWKEAMETAGWLQIKNTVTPYVNRQDGKYVPLSVIQYAAGLLTNENVTGQKPTKHECDLLNEACKAAGVEFVFCDTTTRLINIGDILRLSPVDITELPSSNPLKHATYMELPTTRQHLTQQVNGTHAPSEPNHGYPILLNGGLPVNQQHVPVNASVRSVSQFQPLQLNSGRHGLESVVDQRLTDIMKMQQHSQTRQAVPSVRTSTGFSQVPINQMQRPINPFMQYYLSMSQGHQNQLPQHLANQQKIVPLSSGNSGQDMNTSRSPGASSNPSPRSRPPSLPRPSPGSRAPSASPLSPSGQQLLSPTARGLDHIPVMDFAHSNQPITGNGSPAIQQLEKMIPQQYANSGVSVNAISSTSVQLNDQRDGMLLHNNAPSHFQTSPTCGVPQHQSANQELPGLFSPTGINVTLSRQSDLSSNNSNISKSPPPLQMMKGLRKNTNKDLNKTCVELHSPPLEPQPLPTTISAAKPLETSLVNQIKGAWLNNKSISCLYLDKDAERKGPFCLVEAVCKLYFNGCSVNEFLFALENVLNVPLLTCNELEEKAFIQYYSLPVVTLKCNKMIKFDDLEKYFPQLTYMFPSKEVIAQSESDIMEPGFNSDELGPMPTSISDPVSLKRAGDFHSDQPPTKQMLRGSDDDEAIIILD